MFLNIEIQISAITIIALAVSVSFLAIYCIKIIKENRILRVKLTEIKKIQLEFSKEKLFADAESKIIKTKKSGKDSAKRYDLVTVLFSDIQGFTMIAEQLNPELLIDELDMFFYHFDSVVEQYNIEKIKTIGDAYMCAGGIPDKNRTNPLEVVLAALEMQQFMREMKHKKEGMWDLRIGIHTGSVIAGMVGHKKIAYDIWGDTVNTASRMESSCKPGKINISGQTYEFIKDYFICEYRGKMPVKYKGNIDMYYVNSIKPVMKIEGVEKPNEQFLLKLQLLRVYDLEDYILHQFESYANPELYFHNIKNTIDLYAHTELFSRAENLSDWDMLVVLSASLLLNTGYLVDSSNPLNETLKFTRKILPEFKYFPDQIEEICMLIASISHNNKPRNIKEKIIQDAIHSYYGRVDFIERIVDLYKESKLQINEKPEKWKENVMEEVKNYKFYTKAAAALREVSLHTQLEKLSALKI